MQHPTSSSTAETHECKKCGEKDAAKFGKYKNRDGSIKGLRPTCYKCGQSTIKKRASSNQPADLTQKSSNCTPTSNGDTTASTEPNSYAPTSTTEDKVESLLVKDTDAKTPEIAQCQVEATNSSVSSSARKRTVEVAFEEGNNESVNADQLEPKETPYAETRKEYVAAVSKLSAAAFNIRKDVRNLAKKSRSNNTNQSYTSYKRAYQVVA
ncbi:hypothetical protein BKA69DRAFT_347289 [Paraphysoderma sedebokerense]|nr:hypothetical protein BKA69DRAFT_347289 [Paraphysoderma sedebokerense]